MDNAEITLRPEMDVYIKEKIWYLWTCDKTDMIVHSVGAPFKVQNPTIQNNQGTTVHEIGQVNEQTWRVLKKCSTSPYYIGFLDLENEEIEYFKLKSFPIDNTHVESTESNKIYYGDDNVISFHVMLLDEHGDLAGNTDGVNVKKITGRVNKTLGDYKFIDPDDDNKSVTVSNGSCFSLQINSVGQYSLKVSCPFYRNGKYITDLNRYIVFRHNEYAV